jgi:hypothetical protein
MRLVKSRQLHSDGEPAAVVVESDVEPLPMSFAAASKHVIVLERANLIDRTVEGREHRCRLRAAALEPADAWLRRYEWYWTSRLDALEDLIVRSDDR